MQSMRPHNLSTKAERTTSARGAIRVGDTSQPAKPKLTKVWPHVWRLIRPRRWLLALGFVLMVINRFCGLVLPYSSKPFVDGVLSKRHHTSATGRVRVIVATREHRDCVRPASELSARLRAPLQGCQVEVAREARRKTSGNRPARSDFAFSRFRGLRFLRRGCGPRSLRLLGSAKRTTSREVARTEPRPDRPSPLYKRGGAPRAATSRGRP